MTVETAVETTVETERGSMPLLIGLVAAALDRSDAEFWSVNLHGLDPADIQEVRNTATERGYEVSGVSYGGVQVRVRGGDVMMWPKKKETN